MHLITQMHPVLLVAPKDVQHSFEDHLSQPASYTFDATQDKAGFLDSKHTLFMLSFLSTKPNSTELLSIHLTSSL